MIELVVVGDDQRVVIKLAYTKDLVVKQLGCMLRKPVMTQHSVYIRNQDNYGFFSMIKMIMHVQNWLVSHVNNFVRSGN